MIISCYIQCVSFPLNSCKLYVTNSEVCKIKLVRYSNIDIHGSMHRNINVIERTNKMRQCSRIYYSNVS